MSIAQLPTYAMASTTMLTYLNYVEELDASHKLLSEEVCALVETWIWSLAATLVTPLHRRPSTITCGRVM